MLGSLILGKTNIGKTILHGIEQCRVAWVVEVGAKHHTNTLAVKLVDQRSELLNGAVVLIYLGIVEG